MLDKEKLIHEANNAIVWIKDYIEKSNAKGIVVGNSGGKDSATVIAMAAKAIGSDRVLAVSMPCNSKISDMEDAKAVCDKFNVELVNVDLSECFENLENSTNNGLNDNKKILKNLSEESLINIKPRLRMTTLYAIAQTLGYLVIGTGNLSESMVGYTTKWGDSSYDFNPIANFTVEEVLAIGEYLGVPERILKKAPNDGLGTKTDEEKMGVTYRQIEEMIETGDIEDKISKEKIINMFKNSRHKRKSIPMYSFKRKNCLLEMYDKV